MNQITADAPRWYAIQTLPRQEARAEYNLKGWRVETFAPKLSKYILNPRASRPTKVIRPLFSRYIFAQFSATDFIHKIRYTRGVHSIVSSGGVPTPVDDEVIALIKARLGEDGVVPAGVEFKPGDEVTIKQGLFKGLTGIFKHGTKDAERVMILLSTISYQPRTVVEKKFLEGRRVE